MIKFIEDFIFFPAISTATHTNIIKNNWYVKGKSPRFYLNNISKESLLFHHPYMLTSAGYNYKNLNFINEIGINDVKKDIDLLFGDSGGFQIKEGIIKDTEEMKDKLYTWLENSVSLAPVIDHPPHYNGNANISVSFLQKYLDKTKENTEFLLKRSTKNSITWLNVLQGRDHEHRQYWYDQVKEYNLDGWAFGTLKANPFALLSSFSILLDNKVLDNYNHCKHIHFFGLTAIKPIPYLIYIKHKLNKLGYKINVSVDSSCATQSGKWGKYLIFPNTTGFTSYLLSNKFINKYNDVYLPCYCPVCQNIKLKDILNNDALKNENESYYYNVVQSHNVFVLKEHIKILQSLLYTDCYEMWESCFKSEQLKVFKIIDKMFDNIGNSYKVVLDNYSFLSKTEFDEETHEIIDDMFGE